MLGHRPYDIEIFAFGVGVPSTTFHTVTLRLSFTHLMNWEELT